MNTKVKWFKFAAVFLCSVFTLLALFFPLAQYGNAYSVEGGYLSRTENGFELMDGCSRFFGKIPIIIGFSVVLYLHLIWSVVAIVGSVFGVLFLGEEKGSVFSDLIMVVNWLVGFLYCMLGVVLVVASVNSIGGKARDYTTMAFIPFIVVTVLNVFYFLAVRYAEKGQA